MMDIKTVLLIVIYIPALLFGTHFIRTWAFNRHEAITFECSSIAAMLSLFLIWQYGLSFQMVSFFVVLLGMFAANAFTQWHFYMVLQGIIKKAFANRAAYLKRHGFDSSVNDTLLTMASVAIMPSFSRFIEESKLFNNPGSFIGLIKSIMKRQRFQKKKYLMRECFAENVNLIGPCKPEIDDMMYDEIHVIPGAIHANDLALGYRDEKIGLFSYDILGFGAYAAAFDVYLFGCFNPVIPEGISFSIVPKTILMALSAMLFTIVSHILRHFGFARYESVSYEFSFTALVIATFRVFDAFVRGEVVPYYKILIVFGYIIVFILLSYRNKKLDKQLHKEVNDQYEKIIYKTSLETETDRTKRRFLNNLKVISEWTLVPFPGSKRSAEFFKRFMFTSRLKEFEDINKRKQDMPKLTEGLIDKIVPEYSDEVTEGDFCLSNEVLRKAKIIDNIISLGTFAVLFLLIGFSYI